MDDVLIQQAKQGDEHAFNQLIAQYREPMFRYAYLIVRDAATADDVVQDAAIAIYRQLNRFDSSRSFQAWVLGITRNLSRNSNRAWGRYKHMLTRFLQQHDSSRPSVESLTLEQQQAQALHEAVAQLKSNFQDVIYARYFLELSVEETAQTLDIAEGTVKSRTSRALDQLRGIIQTHYPQLNQEQFA